MAKKNILKPLTKPLAAVALSASLGFAGMLGLYKADMIKFNPCEIFEVFASKKPSLTQSIKSQSQSQSQENYQSEAYERISFADSFENSEQEEAILSSGKIPILMYHRIGNLEDRYTVSPKHFKQQLEKLYEHDFQLISLDDYVNKDYSSLSPGKKAAIITFDDADEGQFEFVKYNNELVYDKEGNPIINIDCAVSILSEFAKEHPTFGKKAAFFIDFAGKDHDYQAPFMQDDLIKMKLLYLMKDSFDICYHTYSHPDLAKCSLRQVEKEVDKSKAAFEYYLGDKSSQVKKYLAFPYGAIPTNREVLDYIHSNFEATFAAWGGMAEGVYSGLSESRENNPPRIEISTNLDRDVLSRNNVLQKIAR